MESINFDSAKEVEKTKNLISQISGHRCSFCGRPAELKSVDSDFYLCRRCFESKKGFFSPSHNFYDIEDLERALKLQEGGDIGMGEEEEEIYWRCAECGYTDKDFNVVQSHAEREHGRGSVIEKVIGARSYPYTV